MQGAQRPPTGRRRTSTCSTARAGCRERRRRSTAHELPADRSSTSRWTQPISVTVRNLRSDHVRRPPATRSASPCRTSTPSRRSTASSRADRTLERGDTYAATRLHAAADASASAAPPATASPTACARYRTIFLPPARASPPRARRLTFPAFGEQLDAASASGRRARPTAAIVRSRVIAGSPYARTYALAQRLSRGATTPDEYIAARATRYLGERLHATRRRRRVGPRRSTASCSTPRPATASSSRARWRCCCAWPAIPARVATGFTTGALRRQGARVRRARPRRALVGRGLVPRLGLGDVRPDARRRARRATSRADSSTATGTAGIARPPRLPGDVPVAGRGPAPAADGRARRGGVRAAGRRRAGRGRPAGGVGACAGGARRPGRRCRSSSARCAAPAASPPRGPRWPRSRRCSPRTPGAAGYVRALREARYRSRPGAPTRAQRRGLRSELARGSGLAGYFRAWWALPPR